MITYNEKLNLVHDLSATHAQGIVVMSSFADDEKAELIGFYNKLVELSSAIHHLTAELMTEWSQNSEELNQEIYSTIEQGKGILNDLSEKKDMVKNAGKYVGVLDELLKLVLLLV